jgi:opacity protein-like surface antigen
MRVVYATSCVRFARAKFRLEIEEKMLRIRCAFIAAVFALLGCSFSLGQNANPKLQVFAGYSFVHGDSGGLNPLALDNGLGLRSTALGVASNFNGWDAQAQYNLGSWLGIVADIAGRYGAPITASSGSGISGLPTSSAYTFMLGPVVSIKVRGRLTPFIHGLFGLDRFDLNSSTIVGFPPSAPSATSSVADTDFAAAVGGGVDWRLSPRLAFRVGQIDFLHTEHDLNNIYGDAFGPGRFNEQLPTSENNFRFSTGIVLKF